MNRKRFISNQNCPTQCPRTNRDPIRYFLFLIGPITFGLRLSWFRQSRIFPRDCRRPLIFTLYLAPEFRSGNAQIYQYCHGVVTRRKTGKTCAILRFSSRFQGGRVLPSNNPFAVDAFNRPEIIFYSSVDYRNLRTQYCLQDAPPLFPHASFTKWRNLSGFGWVFSV